MLQRLSTTLVLSLLALSMMWPSEAAIDGEGLHLAIGWHLSAAVALFAFRHNVAISRLLFRGGMLGLLLLCGGFWLSTWHVFAVEGDRGAAVNLSLHWSGVVAAGVAFSCIFTDRSVRTLTIVTLTALLTGCAALGLVQHHVTYAKQSQWYQTQRGRLNQLNGQTGYQSTLEQREITAEFQSMQIPLDGPARELFERRLLASSEPVGPFALANTLAGFLSASIILFVGICLNGRSAEGNGIRSTLLRMLPMILIVGYCLVLTKSRTAWVSLFMGFVALAVIGRSRAKSISRFVGITVAVVAVLLATGIGTGALDKEIVLESPRSLQFRLFYWMGATGVIQDEPIFGSGPGNFRQAYLVHKPIETSEEILDPHNIIFDAWCSAGIIGVAALVLIGIGVLRGATKGDDDSAVTVPNADRSVAWKSLMLATLLHQLWRWLNGETFFAWDISGLANSPEVVLLVPLGAAIALALVPGKLNCDQRVVSIAAATLLIHLLGAGGLQIVVIGIVLALFLAATQSVTSNASDSPGYTSLAAILGCAIAIGAAIPTLTHGLLPYLRSEHAIAESQHFQGREQIAKAVQAIDAGIAADPNRVTLRQRKSELATYQFMALSRAHARSGDLTPQNSINTGRRSLENEPQSVADRSLLLTRYREAGDAAAERIAADRRNWHGYVERSELRKHGAEIGLEDSDLELARDDLLKAAELYPTNVRLWVSRARMAESLQLQDEAVNAAREALRIEESNRDWGHIDRYLSSEELNYVRNVIEEEND